MVDVEPHPLQCNATATGLSRAVPDVGTASNESPVVDISSITELIGIDAATSSSVVIGAFPSSQICGAAGRWRSPTNVSDAPQPPPLLVWPVVRILS